MSVPIGVFGPGIIIITRTDTATPVAVNVGYSNEFTLDIAASQKDLYGQNQYPLLSARGTAKVTGKIKAATLSGIAWNNAFFGQTFAAGGDQWYVAEPHTVASTTQVVTHATGGITDLGVTYASSGLPLQRVATASLAGTYSVAPSTGTYTFVAADEVALLFTYTNPQTTTGQKLAVINQPLGTSPTFQLDYYTNLNQPGSSPFNVRIYQAIANKITLAAKLEDFMMPEIDFAVFANAAGNVFDFNFPQVA